MTPMDGWAGGELMAGQRSGPNGCLGRQRSGPT